MSREAEVDTEHELIGGDVADLVEVGLSLLLAVSRGEPNANLLFYPVEDALDGGVVVGFRRKAVDVDHGEASLRVWGEEVLVAVVEAAEVVEELDGRGGEVHDEV